MVNGVTKKDAYPSPLIEECLDTLSGTEFMSILDMQFGYWQIEIYSEDHHKTAFLTRLGLYEFTHMPFGLCNAQGTFWGAVQLVIHGMTWREILTYLDDLSIIGTGFENHLQNFMKSFECLHQYKLKLKPHMCYLFQTEVPILGHLVNNKGVVVDPNRVKAILGWSVLKNRKDVESILCVVSYHQDHIKENVYIATC